MSSDWLFAKERSVFQSDLAERGTGTEGSLDQDSNFGMLVPLGCSGFAHRRFRGEIASPVGGLSGIDAASAPTAAPKMSTDFS